MRDSSNYRLWRYRVYKEALKLINSMPTPPVESAPTCVEIEKELGVNFCRIFSKIAKRGLYLFSEIQEFRPYDDSWIVQNAYWFHPYDKETRVKILEEVIASMKMQLPWYEKVISYFLIIKR